MRIIEINFTNINNLKGSHAISFDKVPLVNAGIFAIIGPTGAGKSTILDVITLALFNKIPRFKGVISKNEILNQGSVLTHHTTSAEASIQYEIDGKKYTSTWNISKARTGNLKDYEMSLSDETGTFLQDKKSEVPGLNEKIIGLKYDQFVKSIILSQGQFSKFLKADKNERGQLLENITGTGVYRKIGVAAFNKQKEIRKSVEAEKEKLEDIEVLTDEELNQLQKEILKAKETKSNLELEINKLTKVKQVKNEIRRLKKSLEEKSQQETILMAALKNFASQKSKLDLHNRLSPVQGKISLYNKTKENAVATAKNLDKYVVDLEKAESAVQIAIKGMADLTKEKVDYNNFKTVMSAFEREVQIMDNDLKNIKQKGGEIRARINSKIEEINLNLNQTSSPSKALGLLRTNESELNQKLIAVKWNQQSNAAEERKKIKEDQDQLRQFEELKHIAEHLQELEKSHKQELDKKQSLEKLISQNKPIKEKCEIAEKALAENEKNLQKRKEDAIKIASLERHRSDLKNGEACPLCGALEHPYSVHHPEDQSSQIDQQISENKIKLEKERVDLKEISKLIIQSEADLNNANNQILKLKNDLILNRKQEQDIVKVLKFKENYKQEELEEILQNLTNRIQAKEAAIVALEKIRLNTELIKEFEELKEVGKKYQEINLARNNKFTGDNPTEVCNKLQDDFVGASNIKIENKKAIEIETKDLERAYGLLEATKQELAPKLNELGFANIEEISKVFLSEKELLQIQSEDELLIKQNASLKTELKNFRSDLAKQNQLDKHPELELLTIEQDLKTKEKNRDLSIQETTEKELHIKQDKDRKAKRVKREKAIAKLTKELEKWSLINSIIGDASGNKFANFAQGLTLQNLLVFTNKRLQNLSDRYLLDKPKDEGPLQVIDQYQGNILRAVNTLSGGETFLISLALALSLSDMASKNVSLDSLFIDEGFGTLDQETLDVALDTLEKLQTESQKTVGVISHVEALKERINVQIKLEKNAQGYSTIKIES